MRTGILAVALALATVSVATAQSDTTVSWPVGSRVRVWTGNAGGVVGQLIDVRRDTLIIDDTPRASRRPYVRIPARSTIRIEVSDGRRLNARNIAWGTLSGAAAGLLATFVFVDVLVAEFCWADCGDPEPDYRTAALIGAGLGALIGAARRVDEWREVPVPARLIIAPSSRRTVIGLSLTFR